MGRRDPGSAQAAPPLGLLFGDDNLAFARALRRRRPAVVNRFEKIMKFCARACAEPDSARNLERRVFTEGFSQG